MKSLITGMAGFAGRHLARLLRERGEECIGFDRIDANCEDAVCRKVDMLDSRGLDALVSEINPDIVFHLAAQSGVARSWKDPEGTFSLNVLGAINLFEALARHSPKSRVVLVSSGEVYGLPRPDGGPLSEDDEPSPQNPYALSKLAAESYAGFYHRVHGLDVVIARPMGHTGPGQAPGFVVPDFANQIAAIEGGEREPVMRVGNLDARREFMDVRDVVKAYCLLAEKGKPGEVYNLASGELYSVREMLDMLLDISGIEVRVETDPGLFRPVDMDPLVLDSSRLGALTGWTPDYGLRKTLSDILDYSRSTFSRTVEPSSSSAG